MHRIIYFAKPTKTHPDRHEWETAQIVIFLQAVGRQEGLEEAKELLRRKHWQPIRLILHTPVEAHLAASADAQIWEAFQVAKRDGFYWRVFPDTFGPGEKRSGQYFSPAVGEEFMDRVIANAGGRRLTQEGRSVQNRNADYLLERWVFELKDLQEEGLEKIERQEKLAKFYAPRQWGDDVAILPDDLGEDELRRYLDIIGGPIQTQVKSASKQIRQTKAQFGGEHLQGGLIFLNTGYGSLPPALFEMLVERYAKKDSTQIASCVCISVWGRVEERR